MALQLVDGSGKKGGSGFLLQSQISSLHRLKVGPPTDDRERETRSERNLVEKKLDEIN